MQPIGNIFAVYEGPYQRPLIVMRPNDGNNELRFWEMSKHNKLVCIMYNIPGIRTSDIMSTAYAASILMDDLATIIRAVEIALEGMLIYQLATIRCARTFDLYVDKIIKFLHKHLIPIRRYEVFQKIHNITIILHNSEVIGYMQYRFADDSNILGIYNADFDGDTPVIVEKMILIDDDRKYYIGCLLRMTLPSKSYVLAASLMARAFKFEVYEHMAIDN